MKPAPAASRIPLAGGLQALPPGVLFLAESRALVCADAHFGYEDVVGAALPLWSTADAVQAIRTAVARTDAVEIILLGDAIHSSRMSTGAAERVRRALEELRASARLTIVAGNHEGRTRGAAILGPTVESCERDGWTLLHGDRPPRAGTRTIAGHLHPSVHLGGWESARCFVASETAIVLPALSPYGRGLDVTSEALAVALRPYDVTPHDVEVIAVGPDRLYPFGRLSALRSLLGYEPRSPRRSSIT